MSRNLYALLVGIDKYPNVGDRLNGCRNDAEAIEAYLEEVLNREKYQLKIEKLLDEKATRQAIIDKFENHLCQATQNDIVLFYYAGHGSQEIAAPEIWKLDKKLETIVCWDSRQTVDDTEVRDLADKELRYLISKVAQKQPHILVIFDCCHSSSGTRDTDREEGVRRLSVDTRPPRAYHEFLFANKITQDSLSQFPQGQHIFMAACLNSETAKEIAVTTEDGKSQNRGLFSYFLLKELHSLNATLSYHDLFREVNARVHGRRKDQTPQLEPINSQEDLRKLAFLGNQDITKPTSYLILTYRPPATSSPGEWIINRGALGQLQKNSKLALYLESSALGEKVGEVEVITIRPTESVVQFVKPPAILENASSFYAVLTERPLPSVTFYLEGDAEVLAQIEEHLPNVRVEHDRSKEHHYRLYAREQRLEITDLDDRKLVEPIDNYNVAEAVRQVEHIARWVKTRDMGSPNSFIPDNALQIEISHHGNLIDDSHPRLKYEYRNEEWQAPTIRLKLKNAYSQALYCTMLDIAGDFSVSSLPIFTEGGNYSWICLEPGEEYQAKAFFPNGNFIEDLPVGMPLEVVDKGITEYQDIFKLIASTIPIDPSSFELNSLSLPDQDRQILIPPPSDDWMTKQISFTTVRPKDSVELSPQAEVILSSGITVKIPMGLQASARLTPASSTTRSMSSNALPLLLDNTEEFQLTTSREIDQGLSILELEVTRSTMNVVTPNSPLTILIDQALTPNEHILAIAHDGEFFFPLGLGQQKNGKTEIKIERLCDPQSVDPSERKFSEAIYICFRKIISTNRGKKTAYALVLAFDYESLNTSIEDTARELKRQLVAVGLQAEHGKKLDVVAHSMGGLVSRSFIEQWGGNQVVSHLVMVGTPNGGSPWATVHDLATTMLFLGLNLSSVPIVPSLLEKLVEAMSVTLQEMHSTKASFLEELREFADPHCQYSVIAGSTALMDQQADLKNLLVAIKTKLRRTIEFPFQGDENDIAVAVEDIINVPNNRTPAVYIANPIACDHLSYFRKDEGLKALADAISRGFSEVQF